MHQPVTLFDHFGGVRRLAMELGEPLTTVQSWKSAGRIPAAKQPSVLAAAKRLRLSVRAEDIIFPMGGEGSGQAGEGAAGCAPARGLSSDGPETANPDADTPADPDVLPQLPMGGEDAAAAADCQRETAAAVPAAEPFNPGKAA
jgi:hypothetical protein